MIGKVIKFIKTTLYTVQIGTELQTKSDPLDVWHGIKVYLEIKS